MTMTVLQSAPQCKVKQPCHKLTCWSLLATIATPSPKLTIMMFHPNHWDLVLLPTLLLM